MSRRAADLALLGLTVDADNAMIKARYRELAKERHPDINPHADPTNFRELTDAYRALLDDSLTTVSTAAGQAPGHGLAMEARWAARRRHTPTEYPAWFRPPSEPPDGERGVHSISGNTIRIIVHALKKL